MYSKKAHHLELPRISLISVKTFSIINTTLESSDLKSPADKDYVLECQELAGFLLRGLCSFLNLR